MHDSFESRNELEENLLAAQEGTMQSEDFMTYLMPEMVQQLKNN